MHLKLITGKNEKVSVPEGFEPITQFQDTDVFIVGYPKSGNTWFQNLASGIVYGVDPRFSPPALVDDLVPDVHFKKYYRRYSTPMYFKSHFLPQPSYRRVVYLVRDGRDAMVSYFHYLEGTQKRKLDFLKMVTSGAELFPGKWHQHVEAWMANPHGAEMMIVKYEDLIQEPLAQLEKFCQFAHLERDQAFLKHVIESSDFNSLRKKETEMGMGRPDWPAGKFFFRRGKVGSYRDEMPEAVQHAFVKEAGDALTRFEYPHGKPKETIQ